MTSVHNFTPYQFCTTATSSGGLGETSVTGGATAGKFTTVGVTSGSTTVTLRNSAAAPNGWPCQAKDLTHPSDPLTCSSTTTTLTITVASAITAGDVIEFWAGIGY